MEEHLLSVFLQALFLLFTDLLSVDSITLRSRLETIFNPCRCVNLILGIDSTLTPAVVVVRE